MQIANNIGISANAHFSNGIYAALIVFAPFAGNVFEHPPSQMDSQDNSGYRNGDKVDAERDQIVKQTQEHQDTFCIAPHALLRGALQAR